MIKVFYDGKCGLCAKEINHYKKIAPKDIFEWVDVTEDSKLLEQHNITLEDALRRLHAIDNSNQLHIGAQSFILIWKQMRYFKVLGYLVSLPVIKQAISYMYNKFADWRFNRLEHCQVTLKK